MKLFRKMLPMLSVLFLAACGQTTAPAETKTANATQTATAIQTATSLQQASTPAKADQVVDVLGRASFSVFNQQKQARKRMLDNTTPTGTSLPTSTGTQKEVETSSNATEEVVPASRYTYPFDYIRIINAKKYSFSIPQNTEDEGLKAISDSCGLGELEVVVASFAAYYYPNEAARETENTNDLIELVRDSLLSIRGANVYYTILQNSYRFRDEEDTYIFSSHKQFGANEIVKDFASENYGIKLVISKDDTINISFSKAKGAASFETFKEDIPAYAIDFTTKQEVNSNQLIDVLELSRFPLSIITAKVASIDNELKRIYLDSESSLIYITFDDQTENIELADDTYINKTIEVTFEILFDEYKPINTYATSIRLIEEPEEEVATSTSTEK